MVQPIEWSDSVTELYTAVLPVQYNELIRQRRAFEGERKLLVAVLADAVDCYLQNMHAKSRRGRLLFAEVEIWIKAKNNRGLFSYQGLCEALEIDAKRLRAALEQRRKSSRRIGCEQTSDIAAAAG